MQPTLSDTFKSLKLQAIEAHQQNDAWRLRLITKAAEQKLNQSQARAHLYRQSRTTSAASFGFSSGVIPYQQTVKRDIDSLWFDLSARLSLSTLAQIIISIQEQQT